MQHPDLLHHPLPESIQLRKFFLALHTGRALHPGCALHLWGLAGEETAVVAVAFDAGLQTVIFQPVYLFPIEVCQAAPQVMEHRFVGEILFVQFQGAFDVLNHGIQGDSPGAVDVTGNLHLGELCLHVGGVTRQVSQDDRYIPEGKSFLPDELTDFQAGLAHLLLGIGGLEQLDFLLLSFVGVDAVAEQVSLQVAQGPGAAKAVEGIILDTGRLLGTFLSFRGMNRQDEPVLSALHG